MWTWRNQSNLKTNQNHLRPSFRNLVLYNERTCQLPMHGGRSLPMGGTYWPKSIERCTPCAIEPMCKIHIDPTVVFLSVQTCTKERTDGKLGNIYRLFIYKRFWQTNICLLTWIVTLTMWEQFGRNSGQIQFTVSSYTESMSQVLKQLCNFRANTMWLYLQCQVIQRECERF